MRQFLLLLVLMLTAPLTAQQAPPDVRAALLGTWATAVTYNTGTNATSDVGTQWAIITFKDSTFTSTVRYIDDEGLHVVAGFIRPVTGRYDLVPVFDRNLICVVRDTTARALTGGSGLLDLGGARCQEFKFTLEQDPDDEPVLVLHWGQLRFIHPTRELQQYFDAKPVEESEQL